MTIVNPDHTCAGLMKHYEYREDALSYMMRMQNDLQEFIGKKRGYKYPSCEMTSHEASLEAIYFWGAATTEWFELLDAQDNYLIHLKTYGKDAIQTINAKLEMQYEFIDIWHFLMNVFLYTGIRDVSLLDLKNFGKASNAKTINEGWSELSYWVGRYINNTPFKKWKTYGEDAKINYGSTSVCFEHIVELFVKIGSMLDIDNELFFDLYCSKNAENINRQEDAEKGYV